jgi:chemotaxis signal transduction protein|nr:chemotaxis protein CheW [Kofleriaceae bacterium]
MAELRNVIVFTLASGRYAVEIRWVREVVSLGFVTAVPTAPAPIGGICNLHGSILPVLDVASLLDDQPGVRGPIAPGPAPRQGDGALVVEAEGVTCALRVDQIDHVASLHESGGTLYDAGGRPLVLLDPARLVRRALELVAGAPEARPAGA